MLKPSVLWQKEPEARFDIALPCVPLFGPCSAPEWQYPRGLGRGLQIASSLRIVNFQMRESVQVNYKIVFDTYAILVIRK